MVIAVTVHGSAVWGNFVSRVSQRCRCEAAAAVRVAQACCSIAPSGCRNCFIVTVKRCLNPFLMALSLP